MDRAKVQILPLFTAFLVLVSYIECQPGPWPPPSPRPLCAPQLALVSNACSMLPINPLPPPAPTPTPPAPSPPPPDDDDNNERRPRHGHGHGHRHRHSRHQETPVAEECCHWLKEVDTECVCDLLVRLPPFLSRPVHSYTVFVDQSCNVTYACGI